MPKKMLIDATHAEETRVVVVDGNKVEEFDFESQFKRQLAGNIYLAKVTRVEPSLQAAFVDYGGNRHGFLAFSEIHPDYYQIPVADREALIAEEKAYAESLKAAAEAEDEKPKRRRSRAKPKPAVVETDDAVITADVESTEVETPEEETSGDIAGMETIDLSDVGEGDSPMVLVADTPVEEPQSDDENADDDAGEQPRADAKSKDDSIESVAEEDDTDEVRPLRKPRPKRYKIQEVIKVRQILLIQVVKEERGNKGAALTTYLSLAGRYCVLMPNTARGGGISRKITNPADRKKLKEIAGEMTVPDGAGLIIRTAGSQRTKAEIKRDYEYLQRMWEQIRALTLKSVAPAKIYEEGDLIKRSIRDLYSKEIDEVIVAGEAGYRTAKDFMKMIMPSHAKNVKFYTEQLPLYARYQVEGYLGGMFNPTVQLPSGGYIVIGITEALVAIDVNSGRATKEGSIEQTATKTNLEAADEVARQLRLRDLAGLIVIDFIDMDERRNNTAVEKRFKEKLKTDRARIQVGRISGFGLMEMSRQRLRPGMLEATTQMCAHCHGTGLLRSDDNVSLAILRQLEEEGVRGRTKEVLVKAPISIANFLMNGKREHIGEIEARYGLSVRIECDPTLVSPDFAIEKFKTATRIVPEAAPVVTSTVIMDDDDDVVTEVEEDQNDAATSDENAEDRPKRKRRRRRRRRGGNGNGENQQADGEQTSDAPAGEAEATPETEAPAAEEKPKRTRTRKRKPAAKTDETSEDGDAITTDAPVAETETEEKPAPKKRTRTRKKPVAAEPEAATDTVAAEAEAEVVPEEKPKPKRKSRAKPKPKAAEPAEAEATPEAEALKPEVAAPVPEAPAPEPAAEATPEPAAPAPVETPAPATDEPAKPKRKGWWSLGR
ncbi:ribonuclease E/G [Loktanella sp. D2R18]|uniref:Rne/Rng family ribonuclease n=1 Tax=Rhodobacterales TaxID=204455 RepID=UPI000DE954B9|nr:MULTISPECIES: ribonuclease E/G [Rhodobacterales]MDO6590745.1 Rne/Rng family ribonuclease [Yoonia sp. 1_MG-2023]RBW44637.1 ribonuclease E/G [Loktanella sp. D2R18]